MRMETSKTNRVYSKNVKRKAKTEVEPSDMKDTYIEESASDLKRESYKRRLSELTRAGQHKNLSNLVAQDNYFYRGYLVKELKEVKEFRFRAHLWYADKYYPNSKGGPLLIDQPSTPNEVKDCKMKEAEITRLREEKKVKYRYLILTDDMTIFDAAEKLGIDPDELGGVELKEGS